MRPPPRPPPRRGPPPPDDDDGAARERAREVLQRELDRGAPPEHAARAALRVDDACAEAWLVLADAAPTPLEARRHVRRAVAAATAALGPARLDTLRGRLADHPDGVAYLHALAALARAQLAEDLGFQAIQTLDGALAADPRDPVAVRGDLLLLLLATGRDDEADDLVAAYPDERNADWAYGRALLRRRRATDEAGVARADAALDRALDRFPDAGAALLAPDGPPPRGPRLDPLLVGAFADTEGALTWVAARRAAPRPPPPPPAADPVAAAAAAAAADRRFSALEHVEEALDGPPEARERNARRALELWPDCAAAHRVLADLARTPADRVASLRDAVAAARRALHLPADAPPVPVGDGEDARTLQAARDALATALRSVGDEAGALAEERAALLEDPDDPLGLGVRHVARLLALGRDDEAAPHLDAHAEDASPGWAWARVLAARRRGDRVAAAFALSEATMVAPFVGPLLLGRGRTPRPEGLSRDAFDAAVRAVGWLRPAFEATSGALGWLADVLPRPPPSSRPRPGPRRPS